jgi:hypothetical protein
MRFFTALVLVLGSVCSAQAACTVEQTQELEVLAIMGVGQSWTASCSGVLRAVTVKVSTDRPLEVDNSYTLSVFRGESVDPADLLGKTENIALGEGENRILMPDITNSSGQQYTWYLELEGGEFDSLKGGNQFAGFAGAAIVYSGNTYDGGRLYRNAGFLALRNGAPEVGWNDNYDAWFRVEIADAAVPTLSEWGILLFMLLLAFFACRRLKRKNLRLV